MGNYSPNFFSFRFENHSRFFQLPKLFNINKIQHHLHHP